MSVTYRSAYVILAFSLALAIPACGSDPQSPANTTGAANTPSSISGTVVFDQTGSPAASVDVILEVQSGTGMMMGYYWDQRAHMMTNAQGQFHFDYTHDSMHRYRVGVMGMTDWHMCDWDNRHEDGVVLRIPSQTP